VKAFVRAAALAVGCLGALAAPAHADFIITPFVGKTFAAQTTFLLANVDKQSWTLGGSAAWLSDGVLGAEIDVGYAPRFFGDNPLFSEQVLPSVDFREPGSNVVTLTGNVLLALPLSVTRDSLRPYMSGGLGVLHAGADDLAGLETIDRNLLALSIGGGAIGFLNNRTGIRFDLRHIRSTSRDVDTTTLLTTPRLGFWRATIGVAIRY
jgi:hypothetical protein